MWICGKKPQLNPVAVFSHKSTFTTAPTTKPPEPQNISKKVYICKTIVRWSERTIKTKLKESGYKLSL